MYKGPKAKRSRSLGVALTLKAAAIMNKRPNPPGQHGAQRKKAKSNYGEQLLEKQRLKLLLCNKLFSTSNCHWP